MRASEHLALCEAKRGGASAEESALCLELEVRESSNARLLGTLDIEIHRGMEYKDRAEAAEARCKEMAKVIERYRTMAKRLIAVELEQKIEEARDDHSVPAAQNTGRGRRVPELSEYGSRTGPGVHPMPSVRAERRSRADEILREGPIV